MNLNFPIEETVRKRYSVRNYSDETIESDILEDLKLFIKTLNNPFGKQINFHFLDLKEAQPTEKLGTYGVIKGARYFVGTTIKQEPMIFEALGYEFEVLVLYLASKGLGTCWLGGTFNRAGYASAMNLDADDLFPIMSPFGYPADKKHLKELAMRKAIKADQRVAWDELFFHEDFETPLPEEAAGDYKVALEMVRLGPSASNKQPWRILLKDGMFHFYEYKTPGYSSSFAYDIQEIDMGIAAAHFHLYALEQDLQGRFDQVEPTLDLPKHMIYKFSWIPE